MISNFYGQEQHAGWLKERTDSILASQSLPDRNFLLADLACVGYLREQPIGCAAALIMIVDEESEFFADDMPDEEDLTRNGGANFHYSSPHRDLNHLRDYVNNAMPNGRYARGESGYILDIGQSQDTRRLFLPQSYEAFERLGSLATQGLNERGIDGTIKSDMLANRRKYRSADLRSMTEVFSMAAHWRERTIEPPYNFHIQDSFSRVLTVEEARRALELQLKSIESKTPRHDIDIVFEVTGLPA